MPKLFGALLRIVAWLASLPRRLWSETGDTAEHISEIGHGPYPWPERGEFPSPYAGAGPDGSPERHSDEEPTAT